MEYKVLLADDSPTIQKLVEMALSDSDFQLTAVSDGQQAVELLESLSPDIILADAIMPKLDGYQVCEYVRNSAQFKNTPLILLTGRFQPSDEGRAQEVGVSAKMVKPPNPEQLITAMSELIAQARASAPPVEETAVDDAASDDDFEYLDEPISSGFDEGATVAINPENLRAHLQSLDHITSTQDEEMPTIDDFSLEDDDIIVDDEPEAVTADSFTDLNAPSAPRFEEEEPMELHTEDLDDLELDDEESSLDMAPSVLGDDIAGFEDSGEDSIEDLHLEDSADDLELVEIEELPIEEDDEEQLPRQNFSSFDDDTAPVEDTTASVDLNELTFEDDQVENDYSSDLDFPEDSIEELDDADLDLNGDDDELHLDEAVAEPVDESDEAPFPVNTDDDTQPVDIDKLDIDIPDFNDSSPLEDGGELELEIDEELDFGESLDSEEDVLGIESPQEDDAWASNLGEDTSDASTIASAEPLVDLGETDRDTVKMMVEPEDFGQHDTVSSTEPIVNQEAELESDLDFEMETDSEIEMDLEPESEPELEAEETMAEPEADEAVADTELELDADEALSDTEFELDADEAVEDTDFELDADEALADAELELDADEAVEDTEFEIEADEAVEGTEFEIEADEAVAAPELELDADEAGPDELELELDADETVADVEFELEVEETVAEPEPQPVAASMEDVEPEPKLFDEGTDLFQEKGEHSDEIRVDEPVLEPEEAAYFADTVTSDTPLVSNAQPIPELQAPQAQPEAQPAAAAQTGSVHLDDAQMDLLADMVASRLVERLGSDEIRDIVWQVVPELAEAMIKKRIYQLEQSVDAE